jgi:type III secretion protein N (ATPase)
MTACGTVISARAGSIDACIPFASVGDGVRIATQPRGGTGEVYAVDGHRCFIAAHGGLDGIAAGTAVAIDAAVHWLPLGSCALGRAIDECAAPLDGLGALRGRSVRVTLASPAPVQRTAICVPFWTGIRAIDGLLTIGRGARVGLFGPPGCGKSSLIETIASACRADAVVVALIGERGLEAQRWIERCDERTTIVCATSNRSAAQRIRAAHVSAAHAQALRERGLHVLWVVDSLARVAAALREVAIAAGESVGRAGYPPSVFAGLARLVETAGSTPNGSTTLLATVLDDGDDRDPVSDAARSLLDGHLALSSRLAEAGRFPAIDVPRSTSRTMGSVCDPVHLAAAQKVRGALALLERTSDARTLGIAPGDPMTMGVWAAEERLERFLRQTGEPAQPSGTLAALAELADTLGVPHGH